MESAQIKNENVNVNKIFEYTNEEYGLTNVTDATRYVYVVLTEDCYGGDGSKSGFKVKCFLTVEQANLYATELGEKFNVDVIVMKKSLD